MGRVSIYYAIVLLTFLYIIFKNKSSSIKILIILCFYSGLAAFYGKTVENPYKIIVVLLSFYILLKYKGLHELSRSEKFLLIVFILFSISFFYSAFINGDYFNLTFSQYGKYVTPICFLLVFQHQISKRPEQILSLNNLLFNLLTIQIILSAVKIITIGLQESVVGSIAYIGGGIATMLPVLGFIMLWLKRQGEIKSKDWRYIFFLIFIAFASLKRAIWFIMPFVIILFMYFIPRKVKIRHLLYVLPLVPFIFYAGVRLNPTLNREGKIGGSFDLHYVLDYTQKYSFGKSSEKFEIQPGTGRGGATFLLVTKFFNSQPLTSNDYWGTGLREVYTTDYNQFEEEKFGINNKGSVTGIFQTYIASGYVGVILSILLIFSICNLLKEPKIRNAIALVLVWDYFFYSGLILRTQSLFVLLFFIIIYSNFQYEQKMYKKYISQKPNDKIRNLQSRPA
jgi:hypothetical protein